MQVQTLLQTSLVFWLAQQTLQGGVKPQSVSWGRVLPARGVGIGVKPAAAGALGALGNRYGTKAMKTGMGRYPGAQLGAGGYRSLGLGGRSGLKQGGYGGQGSYGAALGTGMGLGTGLTNGLGLGLGQGAKRGYGAGAGLGTLPGYGALAGLGYPGARQGLGLGYPTGQKAQLHKPGPSAADLGGPQLANHGQAVQDLHREKSRALGHSYGPQIPDPRRRDLPQLQAGTGLGPAGTGLGPTGLGPAGLGPAGLGPAGLPHGEEVRGLDLLKSPEKSKGLGLAGGLDKDQVRRPSPDYDSSLHQHQRGPNCGSARHFLGINQELLGLESPGLTPKTHIGKDGKHVGQDSRADIFSLPPDQGAESYLSAVTDGLKDLVDKDKSGPRIRGSVSVENRKHRGSVNLQAGGSFGPVVPGAGAPQGVGQAPVEGQEARGQKVKPLPLAEQTGRNNQPTSYGGGAGNYLGAGGYGAGVGQGAYLGGAAGKLGAAALGQGGYPLGAAGKTPGYGEGLTGYLGAMGGNGYAGYGNGYGDAHGAGLGYASELADGAENKARRREALSTGAYAGQNQGGYGALGAGLDPTLGKYGAGGAAQVPYGSAPVIPTGLEGDGGYPYPAQQLNLGAEGAKTANKYGAGVGYGGQQAGFGAQLGAAHDVLGEHGGKYGDVNGALGNGYKG